jgi:ParB family chromosome partitioning protein
MNAPASHAEAPAAPIATQQRSPTAPTITKTGAFGTLGKSLATIASQADRARDIEEKLSAGYAVVELDPETIDPAFITDRLGTLPEQDADLKQRIAEEGQLVPILVRPHPDKTGRYQVAYGHRRLRAVKALGRKVRAVVRELTDVQLVIAQGQENSARADLSYIEKCLFASALEHAGYSREVIMSALTVDKAALSRMISLAKKVPQDIAKAIGSAPGIGRVRWDELAEVLQSEEALERARTAIQSFPFETAEGDQRFEVLVAAVKEKRASPKPPEVWHTPEGKAVAKISTAPGRTTLVLNDRLEPEFGQFIAGRLEALYKEFKKSRRGA